MLKYWFWLGWMSDVSTSVQRLKSSVQLGLDALLLSYRRLVEARPFWNIEMFHKGGVQGVKVKDWGFGLRETCPCNESLGLLRSYACTNHPGCIVQFQNVLCQGLLHIAKDQRSVTCSGQDDMSNKCPFWKSSVYFCKMHPMARGVLRFIDDGEVWMWSNF